MQEIDLHLAGADFVNQRVDVELHQFAIIVDILEQRIELVYRIDAVDLADRFRPAAASDRRLQGQVGIGIFRGQVELQLRRNDRRPALLRIQPEHPPQHRARRKIDQRAVGKIAIVDHLGGRVDCPRHQRNRARIGAQHHVAVYR